MVKALYKQEIIKKNFINNDTLICDEYNLTYDFLYNNLGINATECYPTKNGFYILDSFKNSFILCKINFDEIKKYNYLFKVLDLFEKNNGNILGVYEKQGNNIFFDEINKHRYVLFKYGNYLKYSYINFNEINESLKKFYNLSEVYLNNIKDFNLIEDINLLTIGRDLKVIENRIEYFKIIDSISQYSKNNMSKFLSIYGKCLMDQNISLREFFLSDKYKKYCENFKNIRLINGWLSNRSFVVKDNNINLCNFYNSSIDIFIKDLSMFIEKLIPYFDNNILLNFILEFIDNFEGNKREHLYILKNYIMFNNSIEKIIRDYYLKFDFDKQYLSENKLLEVSNYFEKYNSLIQMISSI